MNFELKKWNFDYVDDVVKFANDKQISENIVDNFSYPATYQEARYYVKQRAMNNEQKQACRAIVIDGHAIGGIDILIGDGIYSKSAEVVIWVAEKYRNQGIGSQVIKQMCNYVFENYGIMRVSARLCSNNDIFIKTLTKVGFKYEGTIRKSVYKNNNYYDYCIYALLKE